MSQELRLRILSALVLGALAIGSILWGGSVFALLWGVLALLILWEWLGIVRGHRHAFAWSALGAGYVIAFYVAVLHLRLDPRGGLVAFLLLAGIVWGSDIGAYFTGRALGGPKLAPRISPGKTWSGVFGGCIAALAVALMVRYGAGYALTGRFVAVVLVLALASVLGDLVQSAFKRAFGVKDSGRLIPGHGGFFDRMDAFMLAAIVAAILGSFFVPNHPAWGLVSI